MRVVFDTNILISALVFPGGRADLALRRVLAGDALLVFSDALLDELLGVLARKFSRDPEEISRVAVFLDEIGERVEPEERASALADELDNRILECALAGGAEIIVTGDRAMLDLGSWRGVRILSLATYLAREDA